MWINFFFHTILNALTKCTLLPSVSMFWAPRVSLLHVHSRTILRCYRDRCDEATSLHPSVLSYEGTDTITSTHGGTERKRRKRMAANEYTRDVGVTAFVIQAFCANSCRH